MAKPKQILLVNSTQQEHLEMLQSVLEELPTGDCDVCGGKGVKVFPMTNCDDETRKLRVCFACMGGGDTDVKVTGSGKPENN